MITKHKQRQSAAKTLGLFFSGLAGFGVLMAFLLRGKNIAVLHAQGSIASQQRSLLLFVLAIVLSIAVPTVVMLYFMAWRYRESNHTSTYHPEVNHGTSFNVFIWALPTSFIIILAFVLVPATHKLQPSRAIVSNVEPITIQVMAMRWKWLFIYPNQQIATVNYVQIPKDVPVVFDLTADEAPMSSFWIPNLGGQLYAMTGHVNRLNLMATALGEFKGRSAEINGPGFSGMIFTTKVTSRTDFDAWVLKTRFDNPTLDKTAYDSLLRPSQDNPAVSYAAIDTTLYGKAVMKYLGAHNHQMSMDGGMH